MGVWKYLKLLRGEGEGGPRLADVSRNVTFTLANIFVSNQIYFI